VDSCRNVGEGKIKMERELRVLKVSELRVKFGKDDNKPMITGYAAVFDKLSDDLGYFREKIAPGAFKDAIKTSDARALFNHDPNYVLGRQSNETLRLTEDKKGLYMEVDPPDTQIIRDLVLAPIERGDIREQSFAFIVESDKWEGLDDKKKEDPIRTILKVSELFDVSPVTYPAYPDTDVGIRSLDLAKEKIGEPPFVPLSTPELFRSYADAWQNITDSEDEDKSNQHIVLREKIMNDLQERFTPADPTKGDNIPPDDPTKVKVIGDPTKADPVTSERLDKINARFEKLNK
jgi:hypothetical protein